VDFQRFIDQYDFAGSIILLEGKRAVRNEDEPHLQALGRLLAGNMKLARFRSGNAPGSDALFAAGVSAVDASRMEVIVPYSGHRKANSKGYQVHALDELNLAAEPEVVYHSKQHKNTERFIDRYVDGIRDGSAMKAAYIIRDTVKVLGAEGIAAASFGIFYDDLSDPETGGTGHTMSVCRAAGIPLIDQRSWMKWL
jgi:hypothetical protein